MRDGTAMVDHDDVIGEQIGFLEILRREQQRRAGGDEVTDDTPHLLPAADVESGRRLVEDQHGRFSDECTGEVEAASHTARVGLGRPVAGLVQVESFEQFAGTGGRLRTAEPVEPADHLEVFVAGQVFVDGRILARQSDPGPHPVGVLGHVDARHLSGSAVCQQERGQNAYRRGLAGAVGTQQAQHFAFGDREVETGEGLHILVPLHQAPCPDHVDHSPVPSRSVHVPNWNMCRHDHAGSHRQFLPRSPHYQHRAPTRPKRAQFAG